MKVCCVIYHSHIYEKYKKKWIIDFFHSIHNQTYDDYDIIECCYDNSNTSLMKSLKENNLFNEKKHIFLNKKFKDNFECENYLFEHIFNDLEYDVCINTNIDDIYHKKRFELQMEKIKNGADIVSSNYKIFQVYKKKEYKREIIIANEKQLETYYKKRLFFIKNIIEKKTNIPFSCTVFNRRCWNLSSKKINYPEVFYLSKSLLDNKIKVDFNVEFLLEHRIHNHQFSNKYKDKII